MKIRIRNINILSVLLLAFILISCFNKKDGSSDGNVNSDNVSPNKEIKSEKLPNEDEMQKGKGINGNLPAPVYTKEEIINAARGIVPNGNPLLLHYSKDAKENTEMWRKAAITELEKIGKLSDDMSDEEIEKVFRKFLYIAGSKYIPVDGLDNMSYIISKKDMVDPILKKKVYENRKINVEIVLDASISMDRKIGNESMMDIAKYSIEKFAERLPENSNIALRVFGHKGNGNADGKKASCTANELIQPLEKPNKEKINSALGNIKPTGWTSIADSIEKGSNDLKDFKEEENINILYIITDGIETCDKNLEEVAKKFKAENKNIVLKIIGFNVDVVQNEILKKTAKEAGGRYNSVYSTRNLVYELLETDELQYSKLKWVTLDKKLLEKMREKHKILLNWQGLAKNEALVEKEALSELIKLASTSGSTGMPNPILVPSGRVSSKLTQLAIERRKAIVNMYDTEFVTIQVQSDIYVSKWEKYIGEEVAYIEENSRYTPDSGYFNDYK